MQLFLLDHIDLKWNDIIIDNPELWQQAKKVLRLQWGDQIFVQVENTRYEVEISKLQDFHIYGTVTHSLQASKNEKQISMIIAMPNKREKAELIVQKLTEIGVNEIIFRPSERSIIREWNEKKAIRLEKIMKEALEQSRGRHLPTLTFASDIHEYIQNNKLIVFDKGGNVETLKGWKVKEKFCGLIWPEWGRWPKDYTLFKQYDTQVKDLGSTILRMETAAIIGAWLIKNSL